MIDAIEQYLDMDTTYRLSMANHNVHSRLSSSVNNKRIEINTAFQDMIETCFWGREDTWIPSIEIQLFEGGNLVLRPVHMFTGKPDWMIRLTIKDTNEHSHMAPSEIATRSALRTKMDSAILTTDILESYSITSESIVTDSVITIDQVTDGDVKAMLSSVQKFMKRWKTTSRIYQGQEEPSYTNSILSDTPDTSDLLMFKELLGSCYTKGHDPWIFLDLADQMKLYTYRWGELNYETVLDKTMYVSTDARPLPTLTAMLESIHSLPFAEQGTVRLDVDGMICVYHVTPSNITTLHDDNTTVHSMAKVIQQLVSRAPVAV